MSKELLRVIAVGAITSIASHYLIKALDKKDVLPKVDKNKNQLT